MRLRQLWGALALVTVTVLVTSEVVSQEGRPTPATRPADQVKQDAGADAEDLVEHWVANAMPGENHKLLERLVGKWNLTVKYRMNAESPVVESMGTCTRKWILGKRFILEEFDGGNLALPFQGLAIYGYDSFEKKYTCAWIDTTNTAITTSLGVCADECRRIDFTGQHGDPWTGVKRPTHGATRFVSDAEQVLELNEPDAEGRDFTILEITYTRA